MHGGECLEQRDKLRASRGESLMGAHGNETTLREVLTALGMAHAAVTPLGAGLGSRAWRIDDDGAWLALRIAEGRSADGCTYEVEHALLGLIVGEGARVPRPVRGSWQVDGWDGFPFSLTTGVEGAPLSVDAGRDVAAALADSLRRLHGIALDGYGPLALDDGVLHGREASRMAGLHLWAARPLWPCGGARLDRHLALAEREALRIRLEASRSLVFGALQRGPDVPLHGDLHEENILVAADGTGIIDFGEAFIGPAAWEFAALAFFAGWSLADAVLLSYTDSAAERRRLSEDATAIGLCFGTYRWAQARELAIDEDADIEEFLHETLTRMRPTTPQPQHGRRSQGGRGR